LPGGFLHFDVTARTIIGRISNAPDTYSTLSPLTSACTAKPWRELFRHSDSREGSMSRISLLVFAGLLFGAVSPAAAGQLYGIDWTSGNLYQVSSSNAALTLVGNTGLVQVADMQFAPNGNLYAFTATGINSSQLYQINPNAAKATLVGPLGLQAAGGALAITPNGTAYAFGGIQAFITNLLTINLQTGAATVVGGLSDLQFQIEGMAYRRDGELVSMNTKSNALDLINPITLATSTLATLPENIGEVDGMTTIDGTTGFLSTAGPGAPLGGTNSLYSVNLFTGATTLIGSFAPTITDFGFGGLAEAPGVVAAPEPASVTLLAIGSTGFMLLARRKRCGVRCTA
jgi:hypothetical protein